MFFISRPQMFQQVSLRTGSQRVLILLVGSRPTQNEATILAQANRLKTQGVRILPVVFEQPGFPNANLWRQVSSTNSYISVDENIYNLDPFLDRIHNYACGKWQQV